MLYVWRTNRKRARFNSLTKAILQTPATPVVDAPWAIVSMVANTDVQMYLLALKSFYRRIGRGKVIAIVARDMPQSGRGILTQHIPGIDLIDLARIDTGQCQRGGTWERLVYLLERARAEYAMQLDCDTLTFGEINEVLNCAKNNVPFTLGNSGSPIRRMLEWSESAKASKSNHISIAAERFLDRYPDAANLKYVRASSAFCGFAKGGFPRERIEAFHQNMAALVGPRWSEWGTEQIASNFAIANAPGSIVLPYPKYANFFPGTARPNAFLHFMGTFRYDGDEFANRANAEIAALLQR